MSLARSEKASFWAAPFLTLVFCGQFIHLNKLFGLGLHRDLLGGDLRYLALLGLNPIFAADNIHKTIVVIAVRISGHGTKFVAQFVLLVLYAAGACVVQSRAAFERTLVPPYTLPHVVFVGPTSVVHVALGEQLLKRSFFRLFFKNPVPGHESVALQSSAKLHRGGGRRGEAW